MSSAVSGNEGTSQRNKTVAAMAPHICAAMKNGTSAGRIPAKVLDRARAIVTAGFANEVEDVNQYAEVIYAPTANAMLLARSLEQPQITASSPNVAMNSLNSCAMPLRGCRDSADALRGNVGGDSAPRNASFK